MYSTTKQDNISSPLMTNEETKLLIKVALSDCGSAWKAYKYVAAIITPGYGGAAALLAGIGGSLFTWWLESDAMGVPPNNPYTSITSNRNSWQIIGELHNKYLDDGLKNLGISNDDIFEFTETAYPIFIDSISERLNLNKDSIQSYISSTSFQNIIQEISSELTVDSLYENSIEDGVPSYMCNYINEFLIRVSDENTFTYNDAMDYSDEFLANVDNQTAFSSYEKYYVKSVISVYKNSLTYWQYAIDN